MAEMAEEAYWLVFCRGKAVVGVLVGEVVEGNGHHWVSKGGQVGTDMSGGGKRGGKKVKVRFLEAAVDVTAEVGEADSAISEMGKRGREI
jgi:hypothetical protein